VVSNTRIDTTVPTGATTGKISVTTPGGTATSAVTGLPPPSPTISSFTPTSGAVGTGVTITGNNFTGATAVKFNGTAATSFAVVSNTRIDTTVPTGATTGKISVTTPGGTATSASDFTVTSSTTRIKDITFEAGSLTDPTSGADKVIGTVSLETTTPLKGAYSASIPNAASSYLEESFTAVDDLYVSFYLRVNALPTSDTRIALISNAGTTVGTVFLRTNGSIRLRNSSNVIGSDSAPLILGQLYRIGIRQKKGTGADAILEAFLAQNDDAFGPAFARTTVGSWTTGADRLRAGATLAVPANIVIDDIRLDFASMPPPSSGTP